MMIMTMGFYDDYLENIDGRFFFIFLPLYLLLSYILYYRSIEAILKGNIRKGLNHLS